MAATPSPVLSLYVDETGSRFPDRPSAVGKHGLDWFAIGGVLINREDESNAKARLAQFLAGWPQVRTPLHLTDIRAEKKEFAWLGRLTANDRNRFWSEVMPTPAIRRN